MIRNNNPLFDKDDVFDQSREAFNFNDDFQGSYH